MRKIVIALILLAVLANIGHAKSQRDLLYYQCSVSNPAIFGETDESKSIIEFKLTPFQSSKKLLGKLYRNKEEIEISLNFRAVHLDTSPKAAPKVVVHLTDITNNQNLLETRALELDTRFANSFDDTPEQNAKNDIKLKCHLKTTQANMPNEKGFMAVLGILLLSLRGN